MTSGQPGPDPGRVLRRLVPVELGGTQAGALHLLHHTLRRLVPEDPDGQDLRRQALGDVAGQLHRDLPRRGGEDEPDRVGAQAHAEEGVGLGRDAADLDEEVRSLIGLPTGWPMSARSAAARSPARTSVSPTRMAS